MKGKAGAGKNPPEPQADMFRAKHDTESDGEYARLEKRHKQLHGRNARAGAVKGILKGRASAESGNEQ